MIKLMMILAAMVTVSVTFAQKYQIAPGDIHGTVADEKSYKVVYQLNSDDEKGIMGTL